jgi:hypothetical protein
VRVDAGELAVLNERGDHRPVVAALVGSGEQRVLAVEGKQSDSPLDGVVVEVNTTIIEEADETVPAWERVADRLAQTALGADLPPAGFKEPIEVVDDRTAALVTRVAALIGGKRQPDWQCPGSGPERNDDEVQRALATGRQQIIQSRSQLDEMTKGAKGASAEAADGVTE